MTKTKKIIKVSYHDNYGGWGLNPDASEMLNELKGWVKEDDDYVDPEYGYTRDLPRHDSDLIKVCEKYNGTHGMEDMAIKEVTDAMYRITEYDGWETVKQPTDEEHWVYCDPDRFPEMFI